MFSFLYLSCMEWDKIGLLFSLSRFKMYVNITTSTDCYLVTGSILTQTPSTFGHDNTTTCLLDDMTSTYGRTTLETIIRPL